MSEQILRISSLQSRLDEQRHRAEELHRQGTSDLNVRVYDLQSQLTNVQEKLSAREKQIATLKDHLEQSKVIIDRLEAELALGADGDQSKINKLETELKAKSDENQKLKEKMRNEMINKLALPDLMETMLADKNEEIDHMKEQLQAKQVALQVYIDLNLDEQQLRELQANAKDLADGKSSGRTLSDIVSLSEYDESDIVRKVTSGQDMHALSPGIGCMTAEASPKFFTMPSANDQPVRSLLCQTSFAQPRQINFSTGTDGTPTGERKLLGESVSLPTIVDELAVHDKIASMELENRLATQELERLRLKLSETTDMHLDLAAKSKLLADLMTEKKKLHSELDEQKTIVAKLSDGSQDDRFILEAKLASKTGDFAELQRQYNDKCQQFDDLTAKLDRLTLDNAKLNADIEILSQQIHSLDKTISHKDELLSKYDKNAINYAQTETRHLDTIARLEQDIIALNNNLDRNHDEGILLASLRVELDHTKSELFDKMIDYEKCQLYMKQQTKTIDELRDILSDSKSPRSVEDMRIQIRHEQDKNQQLMDEMQRLRTVIGQRPERNESPKPYALDEIARRVEKELNYSAELDSNILKAMESDEHNSDEENLQKIRDAEDMAVAFSDLRQKYDAERVNCARLQRLLDTEKNAASSLQEQDTNVIKAINLRLEEAMRQESELQKQLETARSKCDRLSSQLLVCQRTVSRDSSMHLKSPQDSPRRTPRNSDFESELANRLQSEIKLLTAQNERERERCSDIERVMDREKIRYEKELGDRKEYGERMKREMDRLIKEKETLEQEVEHQQERLMLSTREIESLEVRINSLQDAEQRRLARRGLERSESTHQMVENQELKLRLNYMEKERDNLQEKLLQLRADLERSAQRETQLSATLSAKEQSSSLAADSFAPKQFLHQLNSMNNLIVGNTKENRQMTETLQFLTTERQALQQRVTDLEHKNRAFNREELEERANHLFGKYLRVESYRKALVHQKKYLLIVLQTYQENESKALAMINGNAAPKRKVKSFRYVMLDTGQSWLCFMNVFVPFRSAVFVVIAIARMKYIVRRWQVGRRVGTKAIFSQQMPK